MKNYLPLLPGSAVLLKSRFLKVVLAAFLLSVGMGSGLAWTGPYDRAAVQRQLTPKLAQQNFPQNHPICYFSGRLGPKLKEGDQQSPEGFYKVSARQMNPNSTYHLSFNLGFPNKFDRANGRTGNYLMVHGNCVSIGCYAMTDEKIEEIYTLASAAFKNGQKRFQVHIFPFRMTEQNMQTHQKSEWLSFWKNLKQGYDFFETNKTVPKITVIDRKYTIGNL